MESKDFKDLIVWQKAMTLVEETYKLVRLLPKEEIYALSSQMRRAAISIPSNIAEGQQRQSKKEFAKFLSIARGSNAELETQLMVGVRLKYFTESQIKTAMGFCIETGKMLNVLFQKMSFPTATPEQLTTTTDN